MSLFNNLIKFGRAKSQMQLFCAQAKQLQNLDDMLCKSRKTLTDIKDKVPEKEFESYDNYHNGLYLMVVDAKVDIRRREKKQVFFANTAERDAFNIRVRKLSDLCESHCTDVLSASRRASPPAPASPTPVSTQQDDSSELDWMSTFSGSYFSLDPSEGRADISKLSHSDSEAPGDSRQFIATVSHTPKSALATEEELRAQLPDGDSYYRILICENRWKRTVVVATVKKDPKPHYISTNYDDEDAERSQDEILRVGDMLMKSDPEQYVGLLIGDTIALTWAIIRLEGHQVIHSYSGPSFISSFISFWNFNSLPLGGMV
ncbi:hypothetical protein FRC11_013708 [Ceratobasidium sp. 423]|nr:hypothetical protein FRC11_013708 [Ceratobasidium sp. 423]